MAHMLYSCILLLFSSTVHGQQVQGNTTGSIPVGNQSVSENQNQEVSLFTLQLNQTVQAPAESPSHQENPEPVISAPEEVPIHPQLAVRVGEGLKKAILADSSNSTKILGSKCSTDQDCVPLNNTNCSDGMCLCSSGFSPSKHRLDVCLKVPQGLGDACEEESQCESAVFDSQCSNSKCVCPPNYVFSQNRCWEKQFLGGQCNVTDQCSDVKFAVCAQGVCTCQDPMIPTSDNKCLPPAGGVYKATCEEDIQCTYSYGDEAHCKDSQCVCTAAYHYNGTKCILDKKLGEACLTDFDCAVTESNNQVSRMCLRNACACASGFSALPGEDICTKSSGEELAVSLTWVLCIVLAKYYLA